MTSPHEQALAAAGHRIWFDTEFIEDGRTIDLISIGMVRDDGATYYAECAEADLSRADDWVKANVIVHLRGETKPRAVIAREIIEFAGAKPELWAYYADYDWVALCQLFGRMIDLPKGWPMFCRDLKQWAMDLGNPGLPEQDSAEHHALADAQWNRQAWDFLAAYLAALPAPDLADGVGVKPLKWLGDGIWLKAYAPFGGIYRITEYSGMAKPFKLEISGFVGSSGHFELADEAKAAAQADYERRIRSALASEPRAVPEGMVLVPRADLTALLCTYAANNSTIATAEYMRLKTLAAVQGGRDG